MMRGTMKIKYGQYVALPSVTPILDAAYFSQQKESITNISQVRWTEVFNHVKNTEDLAKD